MKKVARILVNINLREGLAESINLDWGPVIIPQILDYENVPFRCRRCHVYGHPVSACSLPARTPKASRRNGSGAANKGPSEKIGASSGSAQTSAEDFGSDPSSEDLVFPDDLLVDATRDFPVPDSILTPVSAAGDLPDPGTLTPPHLSNVNLFLNNVSFLGYDWIEGLRKLSLSGQPGFPLSFPVHCVNDEAAWGVGPHDAIVPLGTEPVSLPVVTDISYLEPEPDPESCVVESCPSPSDPADTGYFLRSSQKPLLGLGKNSASGRKGRGRKSNLSKAQSRAKDDLLGGKQISIEKALRAEQAKKKGRL